MEREILEELREIVGEKKLLPDEPMSRHTTFRVGGNADRYVIIDNEEAAAKTVRLLSMNSEPFFILGNGSNLLVSDEGYRGTVVAVSKAFSDIKTEGDVIRARAGATLSSIAMEACRNSLKGFEFASGIPGTLGGACVMNAGAYGGEMKQVIESVKLIDMVSGEVLVKNCEEMGFAYRTSILKKEAYMVIGAAIRLDPGNEDDIRARMDQLKEQRMLKQPLEYPSAGSTFKRPEGCFAGKLIEDAGLKGYSIGGACVSQKHSGFVINKGGASARDIIRLIRYIRNKVMDEFGVELEPEICMLGDFPD